MKKLSILYLFLLTTLLSSCELIGGIFKAGVWSGVIMVSLVIALVIFIISKLIGGRK
jgi:hypothetical protein